MKTHSADGHDVDSRHGGTGPALPLCGSRRTTGDRSNQRSSSRRDVRDLDNLVIEKVTDPALNVLFREKRDEIADRSQPWRIALLHGS